jgi:tetratricopeptide (TPR) repeat protein
MHPTILADLILMPSTQAQDIVRRAVAAFNSGRHQDAQKLCERGLARQPLEPTLNHLLAAMLFKQSQFSSAGERIAASLAADPDRGSALLLAARIARAVGDFDTALSHLDRAIAIAPQRDAFLEKARTLDQAGRKPQAQDSWRAILDAIPPHQEAAARLGRLAFEDGDHALAASYLERAIAADAPASVWFDLGLVRQDLRDHAGAAAAYRKAIDIKPDFAEAVLNLGVALQETGDLDHAMRAYAQAYRLRPSTFGRIAQALTSASHGRLWLDEASLRRSLDGERL